MRSGTYSGTSEDLKFEFHLETDAAGIPTALSGDIFSGDRFLTNLVCSRVEGSETTASGPATFRGNPRLFSGTVSLSADARGLGTFQVVVDLEGGHRDPVVGRLEWQGSAFRKISIEVDGIEGQPYFSDYVSRSGAKVSLESAFAAAGLDAQVRIDSFTSGPRDDRLRGYSLAEIHRAMQDRRDVQLAPGRLHTHVFVCTYLSGRNNRGVLGVMYDFGAADLNQRAREGVAVFGQHPLFSDPRVPDDVRRREFVYTVIHEVGHALNLLHSFDKGRPAALSWMNYPQLYPLGAQAGSGHDGSAEFWRAFPEGFDELELRHLRHATTREIGAGGFPFGVYEEGASSIYEGGTAEPRRTSLMSNPLRQAFGVELIAQPTKREFQLGEPVFVQLIVKAGPAVSALIPDALDPSEGFTRFTVEKPNGQTVRYQPPLRMCMRASQLVLQPGASEKRSHAIPLFLASDGPVFTEPGVYRVWAELGGINGVKVALANPVPIRVAPADRATTTFAEHLWESPQLLAPLYLRHPLSDETAWARLEEAAKSAGIDSKDNPTWSYLNYVAALGWLEQFEIPGRRMAQMNGQKALDRLDKINCAALPPGAKERATELLDKTDNIKATAQVVVTNAQELFRAEVPPNGLFGQVGLDQPKQSVTVNPFAIVVRTHEDSPNFADIVSWNIQHLHGTKKAGRINAIAKYMLAFRCDFWALQEVGADGVSELVDAMNASGDLVYAYSIATDEAGNELDGQQSACVYRTDTVRVRQLDAPGFFDNQVTTTATDGTKKKRDVFLRPPLLCDVRVKQSANKVFDFRCAIVHLKSTDPKLKDKGSGMRAAAAKELARWVSHERDNGSEQDFLVMGDMNAEEAAQGLTPFAKASDMKLLSVGMKEKYGTGDNGAITRFASKRLLDHIVVTSDSVEYMPKSDEDEQIIIRSDVEVGGFTKMLSGGSFAQYKYSDHLPVAVRFVLRKDRD